MDKLKLYYRCGDKDRCTAKLYLTAAEAGCKFDGSPRPGISCYSCCRSTDRKHPFFCASNPDTNQVDFKITTGTINAARRRRFCCCCMFIANCSHCVSYLFLVLVL